MTADEWANLTPPQQDEQIRMWGPPPPWYPPSRWATPYAAPIQTVNVVQSTTVRPARHVSHGLHLFLTIITGGLWGFVWIAVVISEWSKR